MNNNVNSFLYAAGEVAGKVAKIGIWTAAIATGVGITTSIILDKRNMKQLKLK